MVHDLLIIGSGPAGYTAALYAARADLKPVLFAGLQPGGQLTITTDVENYPGFPDGIMGPEMMELFRKQAERFGTEVRNEIVTKVDFSQRPFRVWVGEEEHQGRSVIIATGASAKWLGIPGEVEFGGYGVSACATCDGFFFRGKDITVVGGGDSALQEGLFLTKFGRSVNIIHRRDELRASAALQTRAKANPKIHFTYSTVVDEVKGDASGVVKAVLLRDLKTGLVTEKPTDGVFVFVGYDPNSWLFKDQLALDESGYMKIDAQMQTSVEGVFAAGEIHDSVFRQAITAAGDGCKAALSAIKWLGEREHLLQPLDAAAV